jgi:hypothetical protein
MNDFAFWRALEARLADVLPRRAQIKSPASVEKRIETAP